MHLILLKAISGLVLPLLPTFLCSILYARKLSLTVDNVISMVFVLYFHFLFLISTAQFDYTTHYVGIVLYWLVTPLIMHSINYITKIIVTQQQALLAGETPTQLNMIQKITISIILFAHNMGALIASYIIYIHPHYIVLSTLQTAVESIVLLRHLCLPTIVTRTTNFYQKLITYQIVFLQLGVLLYPLIIQDIDFIRASMCTVLLKGLTLLMATLELARHIRHSKVHPVLMRTVANWTDGVCYDQTKCAICLDSTPTNLVELRCLHVFHRSCLQPWLLQKRACPTCDSNVNTDSELANTSWRAWI